MSEIQLLAECLSTQGEAESDGVKYIYMDDSTVYRFENNRMKKVSAAMLKRASKLMSTQGNLPNDIADKQVKPKRTSKKAAKVKPQPAEEEDEGEDELEQELPPPPPPTKKKPTRQPKPKQDTAAANSDLNEYYNNKAKMDYMTMEIERLNSKVTKLKQYKSIVNKITGAEYDPLPQEVNQQPAEQAVQQQERQQPRRGGSLFDDFI